MSEIAGDTWLEDEWGFGRVLALFVWLPPIIDIVGWLSEFGSQLTELYMPETPDPVKELLERAVLTCGFLVLKKEWLEV